MGEFQKKWFQTVWACLLIASVTIGHIQRWSDAAWAHSASIEILSKVLMWITLPLTVVLFVWLCIGLWRTSERLFWRKLRRWGGALAIGAVAAVVLVLLVKHIKGESGTVSEGDRTLIVGLFAGAGLIYVVARYKFGHWRRDE